VSAVGAADPMLAAEFIKYNIVLTVYTGIAHGCGLVTVLCEVVGDQYDIIDSFTLINSGWIYSRPKVDG